MASQEFLEILSPGALEELKQVQTLVKSLAADIKSINNFKSAGTPSGADKNIKSLTDAYDKQAQSIEKVRSGLEKTYRAEQDAISKKKAQMNAMYADLEAKRKKDLASAQAKIAKEIELNEKETARKIANAQKLAEKEKQINDKKLQSEEKRIAREIQIEEKKNARIIALQQKQAERQASLEAKWSRTGSSSSIPGMGAKISNLKETEKAAAAQTELSRAYVQLIAKQKEAKRTLQDLVVAQGKNSTATKQAQREYDKLTAKVNQANKATSNFSSSGLGKLATGFKNLLGAFGIYGGIMLFRDFTVSVFNTIKELDKLDYSMSAVISNEGELARTRAFLTEISLKYGAEIVSTTERYIKFQVAARQSGLALKETEEIFRTMTKASAVLGLKTHELEGIYLALEQMLSKGKVTTEELRRQLGERLPGAFGIMADALGVTTSELDKMLKKGEVLSKDALPKFRVALENALGMKTLESVVTLQTSFTNLTTSWNILIDGLRTGQGWISKELIKTFTILGFGLREIGSLLAGGDKIESGMFSKIFTELQDSKVPLEQAQKRLEKILATQMSFMQLNNVDDERDSKLRGQIKAFEKYIQLLEKNKVLTEDTVDKGRTLSDVLADIKIQQDLLNDSLKSEAPAILKKIDELNKEKEAWERLNKEKEKNKEITYSSGSQKAIDAQISKLKDLRDSVDQGTAKWATYDFTLKLLEATSKALNGDLDDTKETVGELTKELEKSTKKFKEFLEGVKDMQQEAKDSLKDFRDEFATEFFSDAGFEFTGNFLMNFDKITMMLEEGGNQWEDYFNLITEMGQEAFNFIAQASQQNFDAEYERLEKQKDIALQFAGESDAAKQRIEEQYEARRKAIQTREAKAQKQMAIVNTVINTAQAIVATLAATPPPAGLPLAAIMAGIGAAQVAVIASQKIPEFWKGTDNADSGLAWTQERGSEIITDKKGIVKDFGDSKGARLTMMEKGDKVYTADETKKMMFNNELNGILSNNGIEKSVNSINVVNNGLTKVDLDQVMSKHFSNIQVNQTTLNKGELKLFVKKQNSITASNNNRVTFKGFSV